MTILHRLFKQRSIDPITGCWNWTGAKHYKGYGLVRYNEKTCKVHRLAASVFLNLDLEDRKCQVMHKCENPSCFNPDHLELGNNSKNQATRYAKGHRTECTKGHGPEFYKFYMDGGQLHHYCTLCHKESSQRKAEGDSSQKLLVSPTTIAKGEC